MLFCSFPQYLTPVFQFPSSRPRIVALPPSAPTLGVAQLPQQEDAADLSGYEPGLHPDELPPPVPGHGSMIYELTRQQKAAKQASKPAQHEQVGKASKTKKPTVKKETAKKPDPNAKKPDPTPNAEKVDPTPSAKKPDPTPSAKTPKGKKSTQDATRQDSQTPFGVQLCQFDGITKGVVASLDYVLLRDTAWLNDTLIDFASCEIFVRAEAEVSTSTHIFPTYLYQKLSGVDIRRNSKAEREEEAAGLPMVERRHARVANHTRRINIYDKRVVLFPIRLITPHHWVLVVALLGDQPTVVLLDSMAGDRQEDFTIVREYLEEERRVKGRTGPPFLSLTPRVPQQPDGFNCGIFVIMFMKQVLQDPTSFATRARDDMLADWFCICASSGQRSYWADLIQRRALEQAPRRAGRRYPAITLEPATVLRGLGTMMNLGRCCFVVSAFLFLCWANVDLNLNETIARSEGQQYLDETLVDMAGRRRNPSTPAFSPEPLVQAVNQLLAANLKYKYKEEQCCANEFLGTVFDQLSLRPGFLVQPREVGTCHCNQQLEQVSHQHWSMLDFEYPCFRTRPTPGCTFRWRCRSPQCAWPAGSRR